MAYSINLMINGKKTNFKRTSAPFLTDQTRALILQQHQLKTWGSEDGPTDKQLLDNEKDMGDFASYFFRNQFTSEDFINGADNTALDVYSKVLQDCLGKEDTDDSGKAKK